MAPGRVARWYEMHLADELGQRPEVDRCVECDRMLEATETFRWVPPLGGVLCGRCPGPPADRTALSLEALKLLKAYQRLDIEAIAALRLPEDVEREVEGAMRDFMRVALERDPRSLAFLDEVRSHAMPAHRRRAARPPDPTRPPPPSPGGYAWSSTPAPTRPPRARAARARHDRLADDRHARRPAADLPDLVPVGRRRDPRLQRPAGEAQREPRAPTRGSRSTSTTTARGNDIVIVEGEARIDDVDAAP